MEQVARDAKIGGYDGVEIKCFDRDEADFYKKYWENRFPDIPIKKISYLTFT